MTPKSDTHLFNRRHFLQLSTGSVASALLLEGCRRDTESTMDSDLEDGLAEEVVQGEGILHIALPNAPRRLDPALFDSVEAFQFGFAVYDGLVWVDHEQTPQPMLAESWEQANDLLSWTFQLRPDVTFHHGTPFSAQDVVYTFERLLDPELGSPLQSTLSFVESIEAIDDQTVCFNLSAAHVELPLLLGAAQARIVAHDYDAELLGVMPSGTGPFRFAEMVPDERIIFIHNGDYWAQGQPRLAEVHHIYISSFEEQVAALSQGDVHLIPDIGNIHLELLADNPEIEILETPSGAYQTIVMQATERPFDDPHVRQALKYCVDRQAIQKTVLQGRGEIGNDHPVASISPFWADLPVRPQNIEKARQLLADAGYPNGLQLDLITSTARPGMLELALAFQKVATPTGIDIRIVRIPADVYWSDYGGKVPFYIDNWGFRPSIDETFMLAYHSTSMWNDSKWSSPELDEWIDTARSEPDPDKRKELYQQAQRLIMEEGAIIVPYFRPVLTAIRKTIQGFTPHPAGWLDLREVQRLQDETG